MKTSSILRRGNISGGCCGVLPKTSHFNSSHHTLTEICGSYSDYVALFGTCLYVVWHCVTLAVAGESAIVPVPMFFTQSSPIPHFLQSQASSYKIKFPKSQGSSAMPSGFSTKIGTYQDRNLSWQLLRATSLLEGNYVWKKLLVDSESRNCSEHVKIGNELVGISRSETFWLTSTNPANQLFFRHGLLTEDLEEFTRRFSNMLRRASSRFSRLVDCHVGRSHSFWWNGMFSAWSCKFLGPVWGLIALYVAWPEINNVGLFALVGIVWQN